MADGRYIILGASSFYGSNFADLLESKGHRVERFSRPEWKLGDSLPILREDTVVNFACESLVAESWDDPIRWVHTNVCQTIKLFDYPMTKYVHVSTPEVYGSHSWSAEDAPFNPSTPYAVSRAAADMMLLAYHRYQGFQGIITRTANIYGLGQTDNRVIPAAFKALREGRKMPLHGNGQTRRCFINIRDACDGLYLATLKGSPGVTYHISTKEDISIAELLAKIGALFGKRLSDFTFPAPERIGKDHLYLLKSDRLRHMGWKDKITLNTGLKEIYESDTSYTDPG